MPGSLPPPPTGEPPGSFAWQQWYILLANFYQTSGAIPWDSVDKTGSDLTDLVTRTHNTLQTIQGGTTGEYYHLTEAQFDVIEEKINVIALLRGGSGAPSNGDGNNGDFYFRSDGTVAGNTVIYHKQVGAWVALVTA